MNIDYIIDKEYVSHILFSKTPVYEMTLDNKPFISVYNIDNIMLGVYYNSNFSYDGVSNLSHDLYEHQLREINALNCVCEDMFNSFSNMTKYNIFEDIDVQHYKQKFMDKLKTQYDKFVEIIKNLAP